MSARTSSHTGGGSRRGSRVPLDSEVRELRAELARLRAYVETVDGDMAAMEDAVEYFDDQISMYRLVLSRIIATVGGDWLREASKMLYPDQTPYPDEIGGGEFSHAKSCGWQRPRRRWASLGSAEEVASLARAKGLKARAEEGREWIIRRMWEAGVLPRFAERSRSPQG